MSDSSLETRILIIDPDEEYGKQLKEAFGAAGGQPSEQTPRPIWGSSLRECQRFLSDRDYGYVSVFVNPKVGHPSWIACVKSTHQYRPGVPTYILYDEPPKTVGDQLKSLGVQGYVKLPKSYADLVKVIFGEIEVPIALGPNGEPVLESPQLPPTPKGLALNDSEVIAVDLKNRIGSTVSLFDLFIKLSNGRYVQVLKSGDKLTQDRLDKYREHGAECLYIPRNQREGYLSFCDQLVSGFLKDPALPMSQKTAEIARYGAEALEFLSTAGFGPATVGLAEKYVGKVTDAIGQIALGSPQVKEWLENVATLEHSVGVATVAGLMLKNIGVIKPETYQSVGVACFLHDIGLFGLPPEMLEEDESKMTPEQKQLFREHPIVGGQKLAQDKSIPPGVAKAVEQHHLRINGGFPALKGVQDLSTVAEIIGISEDFCRLMKKARTEPTLDPIRAITEIASRDYSKVLSTGFLRTLKQK